MKKVVMIIVLIALGSVLFATELWNGATSGMTIEQVKRLFPNADPSNPKYKVTGTNLRNEANLSYIDIGGGRRADIRFFFDNGKLHTVRMELSTESMKDTKDVDTIRLQLTQKYGTITDKKSEFSSVDSEYHYFWLKDGLKVELTYITAFGMHFAWIDYSSIGSTAFL